MRKMTLVISILMTISISAFAAAKEGSRAMERKIDKIISGLSLEEKAQ